MAGRGPAPKPVALRQRANKTPGAAQLQSAERSAKNAVPPLPTRAAGWHPMVTEWWESVWRSPMASEYLDADMRGGLFQLAHLHQLFWDATENDPGGLTKVAAEIRLQEVRFGLSPIDRRRLQWEVERGEVAAEKVQARRKSKAPPKKPSADPRSVLRAV